MVTSANTESIVTGTRRPWDEWVSLLDEAGGREKNHTEIARLALARMPDETERAEWWAQGVAVAYEQHVGLRVPGQSCNGDFQLSTSKTYPGDKDSALASWLAVVDSHEDFGGVPIEEAPSVSRTEKWRYWRVPLSDGTRVAIHISDKPGGKSSVGVNHTKLDSSEAIDFWRPVWKGLLAQL